MLKAKKLDRAKRNCEPIHLAFGKTDSSWLGKIHRVPVLNRSGLRASWTDSSVGFQRRRLRQTHAWKQEITGKSGSRNYGITSIQLEDTLEIFMYGTWYV